MIDIKLISTLALMLIYAVVYFQIGERQIEMAELLRDIKIEIAKQQYRLCTEEAYQRQQTTERLMYLNTEGFYFATNYIRYKRDIVEQLIARVNALGQRFAENEQCFQIYKSNRSL